MATSQDDDILLTDGFDSINLEDRIVGNAAGLESLRNAIDVALERGEYAGDDLGDWLGVVMVADDDSF